MPSSTYPNTTGISASIVTFVQQNVTFTLVGQSVPQTYTLIQQGSLKDVTDSLPCLTVEATRISSMPASSGSRGANGAVGGWKREETVTFRLSSYVDFSVATIAEQNILIIRDALLDALVSFYKLGGISNPNGIANVMGTKLPPNGEQFLYREMGHGVVYRVHIVTLEVTQQWNTTVAQ